MKGPPRRGSAASRRHFPFGNAAGEKAPLQQTICKRLSLHVDINRLKNLCAAKT